MKRTLVAAALALVAASAAAAPPLVTGDVPTADAGGVELYLGSRYEKSGAVSWDAPALELVLGLSRWSELSLELPWVTQSGRGGVGDAVVGTKILLLEEAGARPGLALSAEVRLPSGSMARGLGAGSRAWELRLRAQKGWAWFTLLANAAYAIVESPRAGGAALPRRNTGFASLAQAYALRPGLDLLSEVWWASSDVPGEAASLAADAGVRWAFSQHLAAMASLGTSLRGGRQGGPDLRGYAGLRWEFEAF